jgi:hypothetical protein
LKAVVPKVCAVFGLLELAVQQLGAKAVGVPRCGLIALTKFFPLEFGKQLNNSRCLQQLTIEACSMKQCTDIHVLTTFKIFYKFSHFAYPPCEQDNES